MKNARNPAGASGFRIGVAMATAAPPGAQIPLRGSVEDCLQKAAALGFEGLEIHLRENEPWNFFRIRSLSVALGVPITALVTGRLRMEEGVSLIDDDPAVRSRARLGLLQYLRLAEILETDIVVGLLKGTIPPGGDEKRYEDRLAAELAVLSAHAKASGRRIFLEAISRPDTNILYNSARLRSFLDRYDLPGCYGHLDTLQMSLEEEDPGSAIRLWDDRLAYFHLAEKDRLLLAQGMFDYDSCFSALEEIGYCGYIIAEVCPDPEGDTAARRAKAFIEAYR